MRRRLADELDEHARKAAGRTPPLLRGQVQLLMQLEGTLGWQTGCAWTDWVILLSPNFTALPRWSNLLVDVGEVPQGQRSKHAPPLPRAPLAPLRVARAAQGRRRRPSRRGATTVGGLALRRAQRGEPRVPLRRHHRQALSRHLSR